LERQALEIMTIWSFQGSAARLSRIVAFLISKLANFHLDLMLKERTQQAFLRFRGLKFK
jgi:hypothetical protein